MDILNSSVIFRPIMPPSLFRNLWSSPAGADGGVMSVGTGSFFLSKLGATSQMCAKLCYNVFCIKPYCDRTFLQFCPEIVMSFALAKIALCCRLFTGGCAVVSSAGLDAGRVGHRTDLLGPSGRIPDLEYGTLRGGGVGLVQHHPAEESQRQSSISQFGSPQEAVKKL